MDTRPLSGVLAAAVTALQDGGGRLDEAAFAPVFDFYRASGLDGVLMLGTTGEGILLPHEERCRVAELAVRHRDGLRVAVHCGAQTTAQTASLAAHAADCGADAVAVIAPPYFAFSASELLEHFASAAGACAPLPFYVYEYAERSGYAVPVAVVEELREQAPNLAGLKVSDAPFERVEPYLHTGLDVFIGAETLIPEGLAAGAAGAISGVAAAFPEAVRALAGDPSPQTLALVDSLRGALSRAPFQASVKVALGLRGLPVSGDVRAPLLPLDDEAVSRLRGELERILEGELTEVGSPTRG